MGIKISVIIAVYNPGPYIDELITSLLGQTMPGEDFEVIFVDDDSTDGTRQRLEVLAGEQPNVRVFHNTPNSGWPGRPRNIGIDAAQGEYVFFVDNDDWLPADALEHLWDYANQHASDVVMAKEVGHNHTIPWTIFAKNIPDAKLGVDPLLRILTPHKLFRRSMLDAHQIRFPEGRVRLEDHLFVMKAYFAAGVISLYGEHTCYHWVRRDRGHASLHPVDPRDYYRDLDKVLAVVEANTEPGKLRNTLYHQWYRTKMLQRLRSGLFLNGTREYQTHSFAEIRRIVLARFEESMDERLSPAERPYAHLVRADRLDLLLQLARHDYLSTIEVTVSELGWRGDQIVVSVAVTPVLADGTPRLFEESDGRVLRVLPGALAGQLPAAVRDVTAWMPRTSSGLILRDRVTHEIVDVTAQRSFETVASHGHLAVVARATAVIDPRTAFGDRPLPRVSDITARFASCGWGSERRVPFDPAVADPLESLDRCIDDHDVAPYSTQGTNNLSIDRISHAAGPEPEPEPERANSPSLASRLGRAAASPRQTLWRVRVRARRAVTRLRNRSRPAGRRRWRRP